MTPEFRQTFTLASLAEELRVPVVELRNVVGGLGIIVQGRGVLTEGQADAIRSSLAERNRVSVEGEVIQLREPSTLAGDIPVELGPLLSGGELKDAITRLGDRAQRIASQNTDGMTAAAFDHSLDSADGLEAQLLAAETTGILARSGYAPKGTIEHLKGLHELLVKSYQDGQLVEPATRLKALEIDIEIQKITNAQELIVQAHQHQEEIRLIEAQNAKAVKEAQVEAKLATAKAQSRTEVVAAESKTKSADIDRELMSDAKRTEALRKKFANQRARRRLIVAEVARPALKASAWILVPLVIVSNVVCDTPGRQDTPVLGTVNSVWDALYMPIRDGIVRSIEQNVH